MHWLSMHNSHICELLIKWLTAVLPRVATNQLCHHMLEQVFDGRYTDRHLLPSTFYMGIMLIQFVVLMQACVTSCVLGYPFINVYYASIGDRRPDLKLFEPFPTCHWQYYYRWNFEYLLLGSPQLLVGGTNCNAFIRWCWHYANSRKIRLTFHATCQA